MGLRSPKVDIAAEAPPETSKPKWWKTGLAKWAGVVALVLVVIGGLYWFFFVHPYVSTDDERVAATTVQLANAGASNEVIALGVDVGYHVRKGDLILELDHRVAQARLEQAEASFSAAERERVRAEGLLGARAIPPSEYDPVREKAQTAAATLKLARVALEHTSLRSPTDGVVAQKLTELGNILEAGQTAVSIVDIDHAWIAANIEETHLARVRLGQPVAVSVDEGGELSGKVTEIGQATAAQFALIPAENPQGNFIKLVQRVPVKISIDSPPDRPLRVGQSVEVKIRVR